MNKMVYVEKKNDFLEVNAIEGIEFEGLPNERLFVSYLGSLQGYDSIIRALKVNFVRTPTLVNTGDEDEESGLLLVPDYIEYRLFDTVNIEESDLTLEDCSLIDYLFETQQFYARKIYRDKKGK